MLAGMGPRSIAASALTREAFHRFGTVISAEHSSSAVLVNFGSAARENHVGALETTRSSAQPNLSTFRCTPWTRRPVLIEALERHLHSSQLFVPMKVERYLVVVAPGDAAPDVGELCAFSAQPGQSILYRPGVWHMPLIVFGSAPAEFVMLVWEDGTAGDCDVVTIDPAVEVLVEP
jgi:ureidoglycolate lyase